MMANPSRPRPLFGHARSGFMTDHVVGATNSRQTPHVVVREEYYPSLALLDIVRKNELFGDVAASFFCTSFPSVFTTSPTFLSLAADSRRGDRAR